MRKPLQVISAAMYFSRAGTFAAAILGVTAIRAISRPPARKDGKIHFVKDHMEKYGMPDKTTTIETLEPTPIETPATTEVPNAADVTFEESNSDDEDDEPELNSQL